MFIEMAPLAMNSPVTKSRESPGRKNPMSSPHSAKMMPTTTQKAMSPKDVEDVLGIEPVGSEGVDDGRVEQGGSSLGEVHAVRLSSPPWMSRRHQHRWASVRIRGRGPTTTRLDPELLEQGDRRNVVDRYRYWRLEAIVDDLDRRRHPFHVAIENFTHDLNIGSVVRTANAFLAREVHIVGRRRWNRRGAMVTDRYQHVRHHEDADALAAWAADAGLPLIGIDNLPGRGADRDRGRCRGRASCSSGRRATASLRRRTRACASVLSITQYGSTRSINAGAAAAIAMHAWIRQHEFGQEPTDGPA